MPHAEAYALITLLKGLRGQNADTHTVMDVGIVSDCKSVVDMYNGNMQIACDANRALGEVWRDIAGAKGDLGRRGQHAPLRWVPAHQSPEQARGGAISEADRVGNAAADDLAKAGAKIHGLTENVSAKYLETLQTASAHIMSMVRAHGYICGSQAWSYEEEGEKKKPANPKGPKLEVVDHVLKELPEGGFMCTVCRARVVRQGRAALLAAKCVPLTTNMHDPHVAYVYGDIVWCGKCGKYAGAKRRG